MGAQGGLEEGLKLTLAHFKEVFNKNRKWKSENGKWKA